MIAREGRVRGMMLLTSVVWIGVVAHLARLGWPHIPLDVSATDPATVQAHDAAVLRHVLLYGAIALAPISALGLFNFLFSKRK